MNRRRVAVLISGRGTNLRALVEATKRPDFPAAIVLVVSDREDAGGLAFAASAGIATATVTYRGKGKPAAEAEILRLLADTRIELVCLAGFMRILSAEFVEALRDRLINIHPSLLPDLPGLDTHRRAIDGGMTVHGCSVHYVRAAVDSGPVIAQAQVPIESGDTVETLTERVLKAEHRIYPLALELVASGRIVVEADRIRVAGVLPEVAADIRIAPSDRP